MTKKLKFPNLESLQPVSDLQSEAIAALNDPARTIDTSPMAEVIGAAAGAGTGAAVSYVALYSLGEIGLSAVGITTGLATAGSLVGGGAVAGLFVLAVPIALLAVAGHGLVQAHNRDKLDQAKAALLQDLLKKHDQVLRELKGRVTRSEARAEYLRGLVRALKGALNDLHSDLHGQTYSFPDSPEVPTRRAARARSPRRTSRRGSRDGDRRVRKLVA